jgi:hypothetical protein
MLVPTNPRHGLVTGEAGRVVSFAIGLNFSHPDASGDMAGDRSP